jgi:hypothetical protein
MDEMDRACSTRVGEEKYVQIVAGKPEGKKPLKDLSVDGGKC